MAYKFYKKGYPEQKVYLGNGASVTFANVDGISGIFATDNPYIQEQFEIMRREQRGGIDEIAHPEYEELKLKKKNGTGSSRQWREEVDMQKLREHPFNQPVAMESPAPGSVESAVIKAAERVSGVPRTAMPEPVDLRPRASKQ